MVWKQANLQTNMGVSKLDVRKMGGLCGAKIQRVAYSNGNLVVLSCTSKFIRLLKISTVSNFDKSD